MDARRFAIAQLVEGALRLILGKRYKGCIALSSAAKMARKRAQKRGEIQ